MVRRFGRLMLGVVLLVLLASVFGTGGVFSPSAAQAESLPSPEPTVVREIVEKRAEYSNTYLLSNGEYRCVTYQSPLNYLAADGTWQPVDTTLVPEAGLEAYTTIATPVEVKIADEGPGRKPVTITDGDWTVTMNLLGWAEDEKLVVDDAAVFTDVAPSTDVAYTVMGDGVKEVITLTAPSAPNTFTYRLTHPGLELRQDAEGSWGLYKPDAAKPVFVVGNMTTCDSSLDAADEPQWCEGATMTVNPGEDASTISYVVPRQWMNDPARVYPLQIDPDIGSGSTLDNYLSEGIPGSPGFGTDPDLLCGNMNSSAGKCRALVQFPQINTPSVIPAGSKVTSASFRLRQYWQPATHQDSVYVSRLDPGGWWTEGSTYSGANGRMNTNYDWPVETVSGTGVWMSVSCAFAVQDWLVNASTNNGFIIYEPAASGSGYSRKFRSRDYTGTDYDPNLNVDYVAPDVGGVQVASSPTIYKGKTYQVSWTMPSQFDIGSFRVNAVSPQGAVTVLASGIAPTQRSYSWTVGQLAAADGWKVRVEYLTSAGTSVDSAESGTFHLYDGTPTLGTPNGGESWLRGSTHDITWTAGALPSTARFRLEYLVDGGACYTIDSGLTASPYHWTPLLGGNWKVRVTCYDTSQGDVGNDLSTGTFTIVNWAPDLSAPNGGESLYLGSTTNITWTAPALTSGHFTVETLDSGGAASTVNGNVAPSGTTSYSLPWTVDRAVGSGWKIRVTYYNAAGAWIGSDQSTTGFAIIPDEETQHTAVDLGSWDGHDIACQLDVARLTASASDLSIASLGPPAQLTRSYLSGEAAARFAPGWRFGFEQKLVFNLGADPASVTYVDEAQGMHAFYRADASSLWQPPNGYFAHLTQNGDGSWKLLYDDQHYLSFASDGKLITETDARGLSTNYKWTSSQVTIEAENGQQIVVDLDGSGKVTGATYATADGTRTVAYSGSGASWHATYNAADTGPNGTARTVDYAYSGSLLSEIAQPGWPASGESAVLRFAYSGAQLIDVAYPDMYSTDASHTVVKPDAHAHITYATNQATVESFGTYTDAGGTEHTNAAMQPVEYHWEPASSPVAGQETHAIEGTGAAATLTMYEYSADHQVESTTVFEGDDENGDVLEEWDAEIDPVEHEIDDDTVDTGESTDNVDQVTTYAYDDQHQVTDETQIAEPSPSDPTEGKGTTTLYTYDDAGNAIEEWKEYHASSTSTPEVCSYTRRSYDAAGHLTVEKRLVSADFVEAGHLATGETPDDRTITNPVWAETNYSNFADSGAPQRIEAKTVKLRLAHDGLSEIVEDVAKTVTFDEFGNLESETDWGGRVTQTSAYDLAGRVLTMVDAGGVTTHSTYDLLGNTVTSYREAAPSTQMLADWNATEHDAMGRAVKVTTKLSDEDGDLTIQREVTNLYDGAGHQLSSDDSTAGGEDEKWVYDVSGNVTKHWAMGVREYGSGSNPPQATRTDYDPQGQVIGKSQPGNETAPGSSGSAITTYDNAGQVKSQENADGSSSAPTYDGTGSQVENQSSASGTAVSEYGADGRLISKTDASGLVTTYGYDLLGRVTSSSAGSPTTTAYNSLGWVLQTLDSSGVTVTKDYDVHGNAEYETRGSAGATHTTYDALNRIWTQEDPNGDLLTNAYDAFGNLRVEKHEDWDSSLLRQVTTEHDSLGRPTSRSDSVSGVTHTWEYTLNAPGETMETLSYDAAPLTRTVVTRNARGMETSRATPVAAGSTLTRAIADDGNERDAADRWTTATVQLSGFSALRMDRTFDDAGRVQTQSGAGFELGLSGAYDYHETKALKARQDLPLALGGRIEDNYTYHDDGRLASWSVGPAPTATTTPTPMATYAYDASGNLESDGTTTYTYSAAAPGSTPNRLTSSTTGGTTTYYGWDQTNAWRTSQGPSGDLGQIEYTYLKDGASTSNGRMIRYENDDTSAVYAYDAAGQRAESAVTTSGTTTTTHFTYDGLALLKLEASDGTDSWRIDYLYDEEGAIYGGVYRNPANSTSPTCFTVVTNDHGDVLELLDANGDAFASFRYDPWGLPLESGTTSQLTDLISSNLASDITTRQILRYASYAYDSESHLYYCSARYYDPATRQWTTGDPAKADGEESAYQYCGGAPAMRVDPSGLWFYNDLKTDWDSLTEAEKKLAKKHPDQFLLYRRASRFALKRAEDFAAKGYYAQKSLLNGIGDAFRHAVWNAVLSADMGMDNAEKWTTAHEAIPNHPHPRQKRMDLSNNGIGRLFWAANYWKNMRGWSVDRSIIRENRWRGALKWFGHGI